MHSRPIVHEIRQARARIENAKRWDDPKIIRQINRSLKKEINKMDSENEKLKKECLKVHLKLEQLLQRLQKSDLQRHTDAPL